MEVILLENVDKLGARGQTVQVADGYGRNYLLPRKLAAAATPQNRKWIEQQRLKFLKLEAKEKTEAEDLAKLLEGIQIVIARRAGEKGQLFGSVTSMDITDGLAKQGFNVDRRKIQLDAPLKILGEYDVPVRLHREVVVNLKVKIEGEIEPTAPQENPA
jgi:large subunit ribosomal protein L9